MFSKQYFKLILFDYDGESSYILHAYTYIARGLPIANSSQYNNITLVQWKCLKKKKNKSPAKKKKTNLRNPYLKKTFTILTIKITYIDPLTYDFFVYVSASSRRFPLGTSVTLLVMDRIFVYIFCAYRSTSTTFQKILQMPVAYGEYILLQNKHHSIIIIYLHSRREGFLFTISILDR